MSWAAPISSGRTAWLTSKVLSVGGYGDGMDFFVLKGAVQSILDSIRISDAAYEAVRDNPSYHPAAAPGSWWQP